MRKFKIATVLLLTASTALSAHAGAAEQPCTSALLKGTYGFLRIGHTSQGPLTALGTITFDGEQIATARQTIVRAGKLTPAGPGGTSKYSVNADCSGTQFGVPSANNGGVFAQLAVIHDGSEAIAMSLTAGNNVAVHYERMDDDLNRSARGTCSNATLNGTYGLLRNGQTGQSDLTTVGTATFDGLGSIVINETIAAAGIFNDAPNQMFTYDIGPDCTGSQKEANGNVALLIVVHDGSQVLGLSTVAGSNLALHYERVSDPSNRMRPDIECGARVREP